MKTIIAGSREIRHSALIQIAVDLSGFEITELVCGMNGKRNKDGKVISGVDLFAYEWAKEHGLPIAEFPADWTRYGRGAGPIRNKEMALFGECLIAIWDGKSTGTGGMIELAETYDLPVYVYRLDRYRMLTLTEEALVQVKTLLDLNGLDSDTAGVKLGVKAGGCSGLSYTLDLVEESEENDRIFEQDGVYLYCHPRAYLYLKGTEVGYDESMMGGGFTFNNPNAQRSCGCGTSFTT